MSLVACHDCDLLQRLGDVAETISTITEALTLDPGDILVMGTPAGVGFARKPPVFMKDGDVCEVEIEGIGLLRNPVLCEREATEGIERHAA